MAGRAMRVVAVFAALAMSGCGALGDPDRRLSVPAALPSDVPLPQRAVLRAARDQGSKGLNLVFETGEPVEQVRRDLSERLEAGGWVRLSELALENGLFESYRKGGRSVALSLSRTGDRTHVGLAYRAPGPASEGGQG